MKRLEPHSSIRKDIEKNPNSMANNPCSFLNRLWPHYINALVNAPNNPKSAELSQQVISALTGQCIEKIRDSEQSTPRYR